MAHADDHSMHDQVASFTQRIVAVSAHPSNSSLSRNEPIGSTSHQRQSEWECIYSVSSDGSVYSLCCLDGKVVSAGSSNKICVWKSALERDREAIVQETRGQSARSSNSSTDSKASAMLKWFETEEAGVWSLTVWKGRLISGGVDGTVRVWM